MNFYLIANTKLMNNIIEAKELELTVLVKKKKP
jgi:hypothetical protein